MWKLEKLCLLQNVSSIGWRTCTVRPQITTRRIIWEYKESECGATDGQSVIARRCHKAVRQRRSGPIARSYQPKFYKADIPTNNDQIRSTKTYNITTLDTLIVSWTRPHRHMTRCGRACFCHRALPICYFWNLLPLEASKWQACVNRKDNSTTPFPNKPDHETRNEEIIYEFKS